MSLNSSAIVWLKLIGCGDLESSIFFLLWQYYRMVHESISKGEFPNGVNKGLITLIFWFGDKKELGNWQPIILLNIAYKIYAKALQLHVESLLMEVIHRDQTTLLPFRYILNNVVLVWETIDQAKQTK